MKKKLLLSIFASIIPILVLHLLALSNFWYWKYWWFDNIMHFSGGFAIALIIIFYAIRFGKIGITDKINFFFIGIILSVVVAILWEVFELYAGLTISTEDYVIDTILDVVVGFFGAVTGSIYSFKVMNKYE